MAHVFGADEVNAKLIRVARSSSPLLALTAAEVAMQVMVTRNWEMAPKFRPAKVTISSMRC